MNNMTDAFEAILESSKPEGGYLRGNTEDFGNALKKKGYHEYIFGGFIHEFSKTELSESEIKRREEEAQDVINHHVNQLTGYINQQIVERLKTENKS